MPRFLVRFCRIVREKHVVFVEAESKAEAERMFYEGEVADDDDVAVDIFDEYGLNIVPAPDEKGEG